MQWIISYTIVHSYTIRICTLIYNYGSHTQIGYELESSLLSTLKASFHLSLTHALPASHHPEPSFVGLNAFGHVFRV